MCASVFPSLCLGGGERGSDGGRERPGCVWCFCGQPGGIWWWGLFFWEKLDLWEGCFGVSFFFFFTFHGWTLSSLQIRVLCGLIFPDNWVHWFSRNSLSVYFHIINIKLQGSWTLRDSSSVKGGDLCKQRTCKQNGQWSHWNWQGIWASIHCSALCSWRVAKWPMMSYYHLIFITVKPN